MKLKKIFDEELMKANSFDHSIVASVAMTIYYEKMD